jgi:hypothetical protein
MTQVPPEAWESWYRFALDTLELEQDEAVEYANARYVEDRNQARLREGADRPDPGQRAERP